MAIRYAVANGLWSSTATWDGGTLPASTDDVYANNFAVSIDQSITVNSLKRNSNGSPAITAGGTFNVTAAATLTITAGLAAADNNNGAVPHINIANGSHAVTVTGNVTGGASASRLAISAGSGWTGALTINGNVTGGSGASAIQIAGPNTVIINGNLTGGSGSNCNGIATTGASAVTTINGNVTGGSASFTSGAYIVGSTSTLTVNGIVTGATAYGVEMLAGTSQQLTINGSVVGGTSNYGAFWGTGCATRIDALLKWGPTGWAPMRGGTAPMFKTSGTALGVQAPSDANWPAATGTPILVERYSSTGNPAPDDVREGVTYDSTGGSTGTLAVPPAASVAAGVPTDDTVGSAALSLADLAAVTGAQIAAAHA